MVEIWARKDELQTADLKRVLHAASALEDDPSSPTHLRAFAWHLVVETHRAAGLINDISEQVHGVEGPVLLLGALGASRSAFGRWDLLPADGAFLIALDNEDEPTSTTLPEAHGIHWAAPGQLRSIYGANSFPVALNGDQVLVPLPALVAARGASRALRPEDPEALLFCGAALEAASSDSWPEVMRIAKALGNGTAPIDLAVQLGIDTRLGLEVGKVRRSMLALHRLLRR